MATAANSINMSVTGVAYFSGSAFTAPTLTQHGVILGSSSNNIKSLGVASNGQLAIGSSGADMVLANILSADSSITITNSAGGIDLSASPSLLSLAAFGSTPNADGLSLVSNVLNLQPADGTHPGGISIASQTIAGVKTLSSAPIFSSLTGVLTANGASALSVSVLTQHDVLVGGASSEIVSVTPSTSGFVLTSNGTGSDPSFQALPSSSGFVWTSVSTAPTTATNKGYMASSALTVTLPSAPADGFIVGLLNASSGSVLLQASGSDLIQFGSAVGAAAGSATSALNGDCAVVAYQASSLTWFAVPGVQGSWSVA